MTELGSNNGVPVIPIGMPISQVIRYMFTYLHVQILILILSHEREEAIIDINYSHLFEILIQLLGLSLS